MGFHRLGSRLAILMRRTLVQDDYDDEGMGFWMRIHWKRIWDLNGRRNRRSSAFVTGVTCCLLWRLEKETIWEYGRESTFCENGGDESYSV